MYYDDLSPYVYLMNDAAPGLVNIGWIDASHPYSKGEVSEDFRDRLFELCLYPVSMTRGFQECQFCKEQTFGVTEVRNGKEIRLGSAELRVSGEGELTFAAPNLIYHYVVAHEYRPPDAFIEAVMK